MKSLDYLASIMFEPMFSVGILYDDIEHPFNQLLRQDVDSISAGDIEVYELDDHIGHVLKNEKTLLNKKLALFTFLLEKEIARLRIKLLIDDSARPAPYNRPELMDIKVDNRAMVKCTDIGIVRNGFTSNGEAFVMLPSTPSINSCYWLYWHLGGIGRRDLIKVRLDPLIHEPTENFNPMEYRMQVYGTNLNWERIKRIDAIEHTEFLPEPGSHRGIYRTDLMWKPVDDEIHFTCEELPMVDFIDQRGSRYFHAIFQKSTGIIKHCDGALRLFTTEEYVKRINSHIKSNEVTRVGKRVKIFQVDVPKNEVSQEPVSHEDFVNLVTSFFVWNQDIQSYFRNRKE